MSTAKIEVYSTGICHYCVAAKNFLVTRGLPFEEFRIDKDPLRRNEMLTRARHSRTVPQIFINDTHVGGFEDLIALERAGGLASLLAAIPG